MALVDFALAAGATARVTRFLMRDFLAEPIREKVEATFGADSKPAYLMGCDWCMSMWTAAAVAPVAYAASRHRARTGRPAWWYVVPAAALTLSYAYAVSRPVLDPDDEPEDDGHNPDTAEVE